MTPKSLLLLCLCAVLNGCDLFQSSTDPVVDVPQEFFIEPFEAITEQGRELQMRVRTVADFDCTNYSVGTLLNRLPEGYRLELRNIVVPENCAPGRAPARATTGAALPAVGTTDFRVLLRNLIESEGTVTFDDEAYRFAFDTQNGFELTETTLMRLPERAVWGTVTHTEEQVVEDFWSDVATLDHHLPPPGYYGYFTAYANRQTFPGVASGAAALYLDAPIDQLRQLITDYRNEYGTALTISVQTGTGEIL